MAPPEASETDIAVDARAPRPRPPVGRAVLAASSPTRSRVTSASRSASAARRWTSSLERYGATLELGGLAVLDRDRHRAARRGLRGGAAREPARLRRPRLRRARPGGAALLAGPAARARLRRACCTCCPPPVAARRCTSSCPASRSAGSRWPGSCGSRARPCSTCSAASTSSWRASRGCPSAQVIWKHAFKNAALPVVTFGALLFVALLNGSIIIETVFGWPGLGLLVIEAVDSRDYPDRAGGGALPERDVHRREPARRHALRVPEPEDPVLVVSVPRRLAVDRRVARAGAATGAGRRSLPLAIVMRRWSCARCWRPGAGAALAASRARSASG